MTIANKAKIRYQRKKPLIRYIVALLQYEYTSKEIIFFRFDVFSMQDKP
jgi:hypothetical protein